jgi:hypothetical protein
MASTTSPKDRTKLYREIAPTTVGGSTHYDMHTGYDEAYSQGVGACVGNALAAIEAGDSIEAMAWSNIALVISYRYRKAA